MTDAIGEAAGKIWHVVSESGSTTNTKLRTKLKVDAFTLNAALGWLAREDKVNLAKSGTAVKVSLKAEVYA